MPLFWAEWGDPAAPPLLLLHGGPAASHEYLFPQMLALADEPTRSVYSADYHERHELPATPTLQTALAGLIRKEIVGRGEEREYRIIEPFLSEWLLREQGVA